MVYCFVKTRTLEGVECHPFHVRSTFRDSATHFQIQPIKARAAGCCCSVAPNASLFLWSGPPQRKALGNCSDRRMRGFAASLFSCRGIDRLSHS